MKKKYVDTVAEGTLATMLPSPCRTRISNKTQGASLSSQIPETANFLMLTKEKYNMI